MRLIATVATVAAAALLAGCSDPGFRGVPSVRTATASEVGMCRHVTDIRMRPGVYGPVLGDQGVKYARNKVLESAREGGANTVVFDGVEPGGDVYLISAKAYAC